jgi:hypothetical protein
MMMTTTIRNTNERLGMPVEFAGRDLAQAVDAMQAAVRECGFAHQVDEDDYVVVSDSDLSPAVRESAERQGIDLDAKTAMEAFR